MQVRPSSEQAENSLPSWSPYIVSIRATVSDLDSPLIPFVVLKHDPLPGFASQREGLQHKQKNDADALELGVIENVQRDRVQCRIGGDLMLRDHRRPEAIA